MAFRIGKLFRFLTVYAGVAWFGDTVVRPGLIARKAHVAAAKLDKPVLNIGHGFGSPSLRKALGASPLWGHLNVDLDPDAEANGYVVAVDGKIPAEDNTFGSVLLLHALEQVEDPLALLTEAERVLAPGGEMFAVTSPWWAPHAWFKRHWLMVDLPDGQKRAVRLWHRKSSALPESPAEAAADPPPRPATAQGGATHFGAGKS